MSERTENLLGRADELLDKTKKAAKEGILVYLSIPMFASRSS